jgi:hypothetical protein
MLPIKLRFTQCCNYLCVCFVVFRSLGEIGRLGSSTSKQMDAEVTSINGGAAPANPNGSNASGIGGFALSAPSLFGMKLSSLQRNGLANGSTAETRLGEESNGSSDPDLAQANKVCLAVSF